MTVGLAGMVDEPREVPTATLPDLIGFSIPHLALHDVGVRKTLGDQSDVFPDCNASWKRTACDHSIIASVFRLEDLNGRILLGIDSKNLREACTFILTLHHRLSLSTQLADEVRPFL